MVSLSLCPQFETNLMSNREVIELFLQLKSTKAHGKNYIKVKPPLVSHLLALLYTSWTALSLTFDLLCRSRMMLDEAKLSPTSASICTTNRMLGEALSNKCFIMPNH